MSVATAGDRVAAVAAFEEATVAAVAEDLVDADTLDVLRRHVGPDRELERHPVTGRTFVHRRDRGGRRPESRSRSRSSQESSWSAPLSASPYGSYAGLIAVFLGVGVVGALMRGGRPDQLPDVVRELSQTSSKTPISDQPERPGDVGDRDDRAGEVPAVALVGPDELEGPDRAGRCRSARRRRRARPGRTAVDTIEADTSSVHSPVNR